MILKNTTLFLHTHAFHGARAGENEFVAVKIH